MYYHVMTFIDISMEKMANMTTYVYHTTSSRKRMTLSYLYVGA